jgi:hypothetical protein
MQGASNDESPDSPEEKSQGHSLLATNAIHQVSAEETTRKLEAIDDGLQILR